MSSVMDEQKPRRKQPKALGDIDWDNYYTLDDINAWLDKLVLAYPNILKLETIGQSAEGRPIKMITLSKKQVSTKQSYHLASLLLLFLINRVIEPY
jgi:hypothetical protein